MGHAARGVDGGHKPWLVSPGSAHAPGYFPDPMGLAAVGPSVTRAGLSQAGDEEAQHLTPVEPSISLGVGRLLKFLHELTWVPPPQTGVTLPGGPSRLDQS
jgi:hypothetical protein